MQNPELRAGWQAFGALPWSIAMAEAWPITWSMAMAESILIFLVCWVDVYATVQICMVHATSVSAKKFSRILNTLNFLACKTVSLGHYAGHRSVGTAVRRLK